jgi:hypothetical protein
VTQPQNWNAEHRPGSNDRYSQHAEAALGAPNADVQLQFSKINSINGHKNITLL